MASVFVLGPYLDNVIEPMPVIQTPAVGVGYQAVAFDTPATEPGGVVHVVLQPKTNPSDLTPINIYCFFVQPVSAVPTDSSKTPQWFFTPPVGVVTFNSSSSMHTAGLAADGKMTITVPGLKPSLDPYYLQVILELPSA